MIEKNKYYTPSIEEFRVRFKYEYKSTFLDGTVKTREQFETNPWNKDVVKYINDLPYIERALEGQNTKNSICGIRVKILDKEDIESTGFKFIEEEANLMSFKKELSEYEYFILELLDIEEFPTVIVERWYQGSLVAKVLSVEQWQNYTLFHGKLKNLSELEILLKQLNIE